MSMKLRRAYEVAVNGKIKLCKTKYRCTPLVTIVKIWFQYLCNSCLKLFQKEGTLLLLQLLVIIAQN